jgi:uncharacterized SAM-binding protein YcdF (DUF218 family)
MNSKVSFLFGPLTIFWLILIAGFFLFLLKRKRASMVCGIFSIVWLAMISVSFLPVFLVRSLENRFHPLLETSELNSQDSVYILVLGSGYTFNKNLPPNDQLSLNSLARVTEAIRLHRSLSRSLIVVSGTVQGEKVNEQGLFMQIALALGVDAKEIRLLGTHETTQMEALDYTNKFGTNNTLILVTDAVHMPRAMFLFEKTGQLPIPSSTNHLVKSDWNNGIRDWIPSSSNIAMMEYAMYEIEGMIYARLFYKVIDKVKKGKK